MLDLQLGVRWSVSKISPTAVPKLGLTPQHFKEKVKADFPREGSRETPPHPNSDFRWKDYCPMVFRKLRSLFVVDAGEYMLSICGEQALRELSSPGKSGALFYISHDDRFLIKTMRRNEMKTFLKMLPAYYQHIQSNPHTLLTKFYGLYRIQMHSKAGRKVLALVVLLDPLAVFNPLTLCCHFFWAHDSESMQRPSCAPQGECLCAHRSCSGYS
jgi:1-phosphatidylinositol-4-phosphate 5-kinase